MTSFELSAALLCAGIALAGCTDGGPGSGDPDADAPDADDPDAPDADGVTWSQCDDFGGLDLQCRSGLDECFYDYVEQTGRCVETPAACMDESGGVEWGCVADNGCDGRPYDVVSGAGNVVVCFPADTIPCPSCDAGVPWVFDLCTEGQVCVTHGPEYECGSGECVPIPAECADDPTCACLGGQLCADETCADSTEAGPRIDCTSP